MDRITFYGNGSESCGSIGTKIDTTRQECAGSIGFRREKEPEIKLQTLDKDTVCFRGQDNSANKKSSWVGKLFYTGAAAALLIGGLGCAYKYKTKGMSGKFASNYFNKVAEPCYDLCAKTKGFAVKGYDKVKGFFSGKK